jgi:hypothetical protein
MSGNRDGSLTGALSATELLLLAKDLEPLSEAARAELAKIAELKRLDEWSEADVREEIVTPILRLMGYGKESMFSVTREKSLRIIEKRLSADYTVTLWREDFWVIEAKKPSITNGRFGYQQLWQAVQYAIHPAVNAALVVLCDGHAIEIYDREESLGAPLLRVERANLLRDFDQIRAVLGPLQSWFFQKRRVIRLLDKVFDKEFQVGRIREFRELVDRRLRAKEQVVIANQRDLRVGDDLDADLHWVRSASIAEIVDGVFSAPLRWPMITAIANRLVEASKPSAFQILRQLFPDEPRAINDYFMPHALHYLIELSKTQTHTQWIPHWLVEMKVGGVSVDDVIRQLIAFCLTHSENDPNRKCVLLYANGVRRLFKALFVLYPHFNKVGEVRHALERYLGDEFSFSQMVSSPDRHLLLHLDDLEASAVHRFVEKFSTNRHGFAIESARLELRHLWEFEQRMISSAGGKGYMELLKERNFGELRATEAAGVVYDVLGHNTLCILEVSPKWREYAIAHHRSEIELLAMFGSWQAKNWIRATESTAGRVTDTALAGRFFFGETGTATALRKAYGFK